MSTRKWRAGEESSVGALKGESGMLKERLTRSHQWLLNNLSSSMSSLPSNYYVHSVAHKSFYPLTSGDSAFWFFLWFFHNTPSSSRIFLKCKCCRPPLLFFSINSFYPSPFLWNLNLSSALPLSSALRMVSSTVSFPSLSVFAWVWICISLKPEVKLSEF